MKHRFYKPEQWLQTDGSDLLEFPTETKRRVKLTVNATDYVSVFMSHSDDMANPVLLASDRGRFEVEVNVRSTVYLQVMVPEGVTCFFNPNTNGQIYGAVGGEPFTTVQPRGQRDQRLEQALMLMRHNGERLQAQVAAAQQQMALQRDELAKLREEATKKGSESETVVDVDPAQDQSTEQA